MTRRPRSVAEIRAGRAEPEALGIARKELRREAIDARLTQLRDAAKQLRPGRRG